MEPLRLKHQLLHQLIEPAHPHRASLNALCFKDQVWNYQQLWDNCLAMAHDFKQLSLSKNARVAVYLPKLPEVVYSLMACSLTGCIFVPINPLLKPAQVQHILQDAEAELLLTSSSRIRQLFSAQAIPDSLHHVIAMDNLNFAQLNTEGLKSYPALQIHPTHSLCANYPLHTLSSQSISTQQLAAILYTSGSTGKPKGVMLSHQNLIAGAASVTQYLNNQSSDRLLALLPLSFDYGLNQILSAFYVDATVVLMDYLLPQDVVKALHNYQITGLAAVPPLWQQLAKLNWQDKDRVNLRYFTNSGGAMPTTTLAQLRQIFPNATPYLMYGLTEAFRSTYLDPTEIDKRPQSIGKAIPGAEVLVLRSDGTLCDAMEQGELVHFGVHVAQGYWRDPERTQQKFRPLSVPSHNQQSPETHTAVWSGDRVYRDDEGFIYFIARADEMIKTSGYRVSPEEIEEVLLQHPQVLEVVALGAPHPQLGDAIILVVVFDEQQQDEIELKKEIEAFCKKQLPNFMQPQHIVIQAELTKNANGKQDRARLKSRFHGFFSPQDPPIISTLDPQISD